MLGDALLAEIKKALVYDPTTGKFTWLIDRIGNRGVFSEAGTLSHGYVIICFSDSEGVRHLIRAHRLAWWMKTGVMPTEIDHINRDRSDNRWVNLREVTRTENNFNTKTRSDNVSGKSGVSWIPRDEKWLARFKMRGQIFELGTFVNLDDAIAARRNAELQYLGALCPS